MTDVATLQRLLAQPESEWIEFKHNDADPQDVGEYLSALANAAALHGQEAGWLVWGVEDSTRAAVGTDLDPRARKKGNEPVLTWWARMLDPRIDFEFREVHLDGRRLVTLRVQAAAGYPVAFSGTRWIRIGSARKRLSEYPGKELSLWNALARTSYEHGIARSGVDATALMDLLDHRALFGLLQQPVPSEPNAIAARLCIEELAVDRGSGRFDITRLGALSFARDLRDFGPLGRKTLRFVRYKGSDRTRGEYEHEFVGGYAAGFAGIVGYLVERSPRNEVLAQALRREVRMYPDIALRELVGNALIHQDLTLGGTGPMVELFDDRLEISNPGLPLVEPLRFLDHAPRSRNERLASLMRRLGICEERGSGFDKAMVSLELLQLPAPEIRVDDSHTRVVLFAHRDLKRGDKAGRVRACYFHACLRYVSGRQTTNASLRERLGLEEDDYTVVSRFIRETIEARMIKPADPTNRSRKYAHYVPFWV